MSFSFYPPSSLRRLKVCATAAVFSMVFLAGTDSAGSQHFPEFLSAVLVTPRLLLEEKKSLWRTTPFPYLGNHWLSTPLSSRHITLSARRAFLMMNTFSKTKIADMGRCANRTMLETSDCRFRLFPVRQITLAPSLSLTTSPSVLQPFPLLFHPKYLTSNTHLRFCYCPYLPKHPKHVRTPASKRKSLIFLHNFLLI